jgi:hypothetical protein
MWLAAARESQKCADELTGLIGRETRSLQRQAKGIKRNYETRMKAFAQPHKLCSEELTKCTQEKSEVSQGYRARKDVARRRKRSIKSVSS